jgi:hypothetical protein
MRGISVGELAELTKIPTRSIERMEAGAFDGNPDGFVRGFVRTIAVGLGLDPEEAVMRMLGEPADLAGAAGGSALPLDRRLLAIVAMLRRSSIAAMPCAPWPTSRLGHRPLRGAPWAARSR